MQRFALLLLVASVTLLGIVVPVDAARHTRRETNAQRFERSLGPLPPLKRSRTDTAKRGQISQRQTESIGVLQVQFAENGTTLGWVQNDPNGPTGLNLASDISPTDTNLIVSFSNGYLVAQGPQFSLPFVGGSGSDILTPSTLTAVQFTDVSDGPGADIWTFDSTTGQLNVTWTNSDGSTVTPTLIYDNDVNDLSLTANPLGFANALNQIPCTIFIAQ